MDLVLDFETNPLPFADNSIDAVFSAHSLEHLRRVSKALREVVRVCRHDASVEIWTPYLKSDEAFLQDHNIYFNERMWQNICFASDRAVLGNTPGYFLWEETRYHLKPGVPSMLKEFNLPIGFAVNHMFNICIEWGVFLRVKKDEPRAPGPQAPKVTYCLGRRDNLIAIPDRIAGQLCDVV